MSRTITAVLAAALAVVAGPDVQLLPAGPFAARDGRPGPGKTWTLSDPQGQALAAALNARHADGRARFNFDYEHGTLHQAAKGLPNPASGWASRFEWRPGQGLYALSVQWTPRAKGLIDAQEYQYVSPLITFDDATGAVTDVLCAALTNYPALMQLEPLQALNAAFTPQEQPPMNLLAQLCAALELAADTTEQSALTAVAALKAKSEKPPATVTALSAAVTGALGLAAGADEAAALGAITALRAKATGADPTTLQTITALQAQIADLTARMAGSEVATLIDQAVKDGKLLPAQRAWAESLGRANLAQLQAFIKDAPVVAAGLGATQSQGKDPGAGDKTAALSAEELKVATALGLTPEEFKKAAPAA